jgi:hypothetical protein
MNENVLKATLVRLMRITLPTYIIEPSQDRNRYGTPDLCITGNGYVSRLEIKYADPDFDSTGIQELMMKRLWAQGGQRAFYVIYHRSLTNESRTHIVKPDHFKGLWAQNSERIWPGMHHKAVITFIRELHNDPVKS